jgi:hypothetical protein
MHASAPETHADSARYTCSYDDCDHVFREIQQYGEGVEDQINVSQTPNQLLN